MNYSTGSSDRTARVANTREVASIAMNGSDIKSSEASGFKHDFLAEIFTAYKAAGAAYRETTDPETRRTLLAMKHGFDMAIRRLLPIDDNCLQSLNALNAPFAN
jgi:hypothetical protein